MNKKIYLLGIGVNVLDRKEIAQVILEFSKGDSIRTAYYLNAHCANLAFVDAEYMSILNKSDLVYAGGQGIVWASRFLGEPLPERVNILDFFDYLTKGLIDKGINIYLLGGEKATVNKAEKTLKKKGLNIVGYRDGFFGQEEERDIITEINSLSPDILMVGMGVPKQEKWIYNHLNELDVRLCWAVGGVFKIFSGELKRPPRWIINAGLEWLSLGLQDPERLLKRYLTGNIVFLYNVLRWKMAHGENI